MISPISKNESSDLKVRIVVGSVCSICFLFLLLGQRKPSIVVYLSLERQIDFVFFILIGFVLTSWAWLLRQRLQKQSPGFHFIEWPGLKRTTVIILFQLPCYVQDCQTRLPRATSSLALNACRDGASTTSLGNLFQCVTTLCVKNLLLISNLNLPCPSLKPFPLVLSPSILINSHSPSCLYAPFKYWKATMWSPQILQ